MSHEPTHRYEWNTIPWRKLEIRVFKLQRRIYQAIARGDTPKAHKLQKLLATSWSAKCLAVRRVTQDNKGKKTAGVDGIKALTPLQRLHLISQIPPDLVVKWQAIDIADVIFPLIWRRRLVHTGGQNRKSAL